MTALTATLAATGALRGVDQYAVDHLMPWLQVRHHPFVTFGSLTVPSFEPPAAQHRARALDVPGGARAVAAHRPRRGLAARTRRAAIAWCALWCAGNAIELAGKLSLRKPALYHHTFHVSAFDTSLPSGHTIRALILAGAVAAAWRSGRLAYVWAATVPVRTRRDRRAHAVGCRDRRLRRDGARRVGAERTTA